MKVVFAEIAVGFMAGIVYTKQKISTKEQQETDHVTDNNHRETLIIALMA